MDGNKNIIHVLMTDYSLDSRVRNETNSLSKNKYDVSVFCMNGQEQPASEVRENVKIKRFGLLSNKMIRFISAYIGMLWAVRKCNVDVVHAHDLTALPVAYGIAKLKKSCLIYDSHELWSHSHHNASHPSWLISCMCWLEKLLGSKVDAVISVSDGITNFLKQYLSISNAVTIRNIPSYNHVGEFDLFREEYAIPSNKKIFIYQGLISRSRGVDTLLNAAIKICSTGKAAFVFMGSGPYVDELVQKMECSNVEHLFYKPSVPQDELLKYTKSADVGVHAIKNTCLNHDLCLPNKLFEYVGSVLPVVVTNLSEMSKFVNHYNVGLCFDEGASDDLFEKMDVLVSSENLFNHYKASVEKASKIIKWDEESKLLLKLYDGLL